MTVKQRKQQMKRDIILTSLCEPRPKLSIDQFKIIELQSGNSALLIMFFCANLYWT
jgi:hypothetical protein